MTGVTSAGSGPTSVNIRFSTPQGGTYNINCTIYYILTAATAPMSLSVMNTSSSVLDITWGVPLCDNGIRTGYIVSI